RKLTGLPLGGEETGHAEPILDPTGYSPAQIACGVGILLDHPLSGATVFRSFGNAGAVDLNHLPSPSLVMGGDYHDGMRLQDKKYRHGNFFDTDAKVPPPAESQAIKNPPGGGWE